MTPFRATRARVSSDIHRGSDNDQIKMPIIFDELRLRHRQVIAGARAFAGGNRNREGICQLLERELIRPDALQGNGDFFGLHGF